jgi:NosR/NirI family transcriptional regulator, nitrous oxide reductase regulator
MRNFRLLYLMFTLGFIGWWGQAQLTIVNLTALIESLRSGDGVEFLIADPMSLVLWVFVIASLFIWGRGTFCGWLCPFGALQDLIAQLGALVRIKQIALRISIDSKLKWIKYVLLACILGSAALSSASTDQLIEVEPFKTAISLYFVRAWPYVLWAVACLGLSVFVFRGYCRYICPLGAALAVVGKVRIFNWIPRKKECGTPCQTCRHSCSYQAISPKGKVDYDECFQCLDCVRIEQDEKRCLPLIQQVRARVIPVHAVELARAR